MKDSLLIIYNLTVLIFPISFIVSFLKTKKPTNFSYMKGFYWYSLVAMIILVFFLLSIFNYINKDLFSQINIISFIYHYYFFSKFIYKVIKGNNYTKIFNTIYYIFFLLTIASSIFSFFYIEYRGFPLAVANIGLIVLSLFYYNFLFEDDRNLNLSQEPAFLIITGIVLGMSFNIPSHSLSKQLVMSFQEEITQWIFIFGAFGYVLMHLFFIKASLLCSVQTSEK